MMEMQVDNFLAHYGVKGMKWGVRRKELRAAQPPTKRQQKAAIHQAKADEAQKKIDALMKKPVRFGGRNRRLAQIQKESAVQLHEQRTADALANRKLTPNQKTLLAGTALATTLVATYGSAELRYREQVRIADHMNKIANPWEGPPKL